jgi:hypothetical protein
MLARDHLSKRTWRGEIGGFDEIDQITIWDWAEESVQVSIKTVYKNLDPEITRFVDVPVGYDADARRTARRRVALAGYRLAEELKRLVASW